MTTTFTRLPSPVGELLLTASEQGISGIYFPTRDRTPKGRTEWREDSGAGPASAWLAQARQQLTEYFAGTRTKFELPLDPSGTEFQRRV